jgi:hypothetical protein
MLSKTLIVLFSLFTPPIGRTILLYSTYLAVEGGGDQGGHDDHGDNDLDGGGDGRSHVECVVYFLLIDAREMKSRIMSCVRGRCEGSTLEIVVQSAMPNVSTFNFFEIW